METEILSRSQRELLVDRWQNGRLVPVVGAGMSIPARIPAWSDLLSNILDYVFREGMLAQGLSRDNVRPDVLEFFRAGLAEMSPIVAARHIRALMSDPARFSHAVYMGLYYDLVAPPVPTPALLAIAALGASSPVFLTYNFDDLLERALTHRGLQFRSVDGPNSHPPRPGDITVYHPHGFLPYVEHVVWDPHDPAAPIVLSEESYHERYSDLLNWSTWVQLDLMQRYTLLFFGVSLRDPNVRRILEIAATTGTSRHFLVRLARSIRTPWEHAWRQAQERVLDELGLETIEIAEFSEIEAVVGEISY